MSEQTPIAASPLNRVPLVTPEFWLIKLMAVTMGETAADYIAVNMGLGLAATSLIMTAVLIVALGLQFARKRYVPWAYWLAVVLISVVGTLVTDNLVDNLGVPLEINTIAFTVLLAVTFAVWYAFEKTLSIHSITTARREAVYWLAILLTFALGTSAGDLMAEKFAFGYLVTAAIFAVIIGTITAAYYVLKLNGIVAFWLAYILTRPMGASIGDLLSQPTDYGGLGFGTIVTSIAFLSIILATVVLMTLRQKPEKDMLQGSAART